jgi:hypothetical protein
MSTSDHKNKIEDLKRSISRNRIIVQILSRVTALSIPNWYLGAGCIAQTVWNEFHGFQPSSNIKDYDLVYFDASNFSLQAEDSMVKSVQMEVKDLGVVVQVKNEARVHLWYKDHFGYSIQPYASVEDAISSWPTTATSIGVRFDPHGSFAVFAPFGLEDLFGLIVRPNKKQITKEIYMEKVQRWIKTWPKLKVIPW